MNNSLYNKLTKVQQMYVDSIRGIGEQWGYDLTKTDWTRRELVAISMKRQGNDDVPNWIVKDQSRRVGRGVYSIPELPLEAAPHAEELSDLMQPRQETDAEYESRVKRIHELEAVSPGHGHEGDELADTAPSPAPTEQPPDGGGLPPDLSTPQQKIVKNKLQNSATGIPH